MNISTGQGLLLQIPFADGVACAYRRTFLVIDANLIDNKITLLNVSSVAGKTHKVLFSSNQLIKRYRPPFMKSSFVKLDSIYEVEYFAKLDSAILHNGDPLDSTEFRSIHSRYVAYSGSNSVVRVFYEPDKVVI